MLEVARGSHPDTTPIFIAPKNVWQAHMGYIDVNLKILGVPKGGNMTDHFWHHFLKWILMIQENVNPSFIVFAYLPKDLTHESDALYKPKDLGKTLSNIRKYANNVRPQMKEQISYMNL